MQHLLLALCGIVFTLSSPSYAYIASEGNVTASYGVFLHKTNFEGSDQLRPAPVLGDLGFITNGDLTDKGSLEIALFHMNKIYYRSQNNLYLAEKTELIQVTMGYRRWISEYFSAGLGFYAAYSIGDHRTLHSESGIDLQIDTSARDTVEYGFDFSIQQELWAKDKESVFADLRYAHSIANKANEKGNHYALFIGYRVMVQEKNPTHSPSTSPSEKDLAPDQFVEPRTDVSPGESP